MQIKLGLKQILDILNDNNLSSDKKLSLIDVFLPRKTEYKFVSMKDLLLKQASESKSTKFRLLGTMNDDICIFNWCDEEYNFIGMCPSKEYTDLKVEYSLDELYEVIDKAEQYLKDSKESENLSGSP